MDKLIHSDVMPEGFDHCLTVMADADVFSKAASAAHFDWAKDPDLHPPKGHVGVHLIALGDSEHFGFNRNGDGFPKHACKAHHESFVKHAGVYRHHRNKDKTKSLGIVKRSGYNEPQARVELFLHVDEKKAADELTRWEKEGEAPFSMGCRVPNDRCSRCNTLRKNPKDTNQCDHVRYELGKVAEDGTVTGVYNDKPNFFDISFVARPADRIAWHLSKVAGAAATQDLPSAVELAEAAGLCFPGEEVFGSPKLAQARTFRELEGCIIKTASCTPETEGEAYIKLFASTDPGQVLPDSVLDSLAEFDFKVASASLAAKQIVLDPTSFFKLALGTRQEDWADSVGDAAHTAIKLASGGAFSALEAAGLTKEACASTEYDIGLARPDSMIAGILHRHANMASSDPELAGYRARLAVVDGGVKTAAPALYDPNSADPVANALLAQYCTYKLAAVAAIEHSGRDVDSWKLSAIVASQGFA